MHYEDGDIAYDEAKDKMLLCSSNKEVLTLHKQHTTLTRFLPEKYRYYLYTVDYRTKNIYAKSIQSWRQDALHRSIHQNK
jgi:hypothetical protein